MRSGVALESTWQPPSREWSCLGAHSLCLPACPQTFQDFGEHGRELISSEIGLRLLGALCDGGDALAALAGRAGVGLEELQEVLNRTVLQVGACLWEGGP